jgi:vacuolar-type H+-ATPase catalytic subunit A/Vma1
MNAIIFSMLVLILVFLVFIVIDRRKDNKALFDAIELLTSKQTKSVKDYVEHAAKVNTDYMVELMENTKNFLNKEIQRVKNNLFEIEERTKDNIFASEGRIIKTIEQQVQSMDQSNCNVLVDMMHKLIDANNKIYAELQKINKPKVTNKTIDKATVNFKKDTANKKQKEETKNEAKNS